MSTGAGTLLVIVSSLAFGAMALFARVAYAAGTAPITLLFLRFGIAAGCMAFIVAVRREPLPTGKVLAGLALMGGVGYVGQSFSFFTALTLAHAGLVALLLYLYPAIVAVLSALFLRERLSPPRVVAVAMAFIGTALTVGPRPAGTPAGIALGIAAAFIYSAYIMAGTHLLRRSSPISGALVVMSSAAIVFAVINVIRGPAFPQTPAGWWAAVGVAIVSTAFAVTLFLIGIAVIGPTKASVLSTFEPITTVVLAAIILGEPLSVLTAIGGACIIGATVILARHQEGTPAPRVAVDPAIDPANGDDSL